MHSYPGPAPTNGPSTTTWRRERLMGIGNSPTINAGVLDSSPDDNVFEPSLPESPTESTSLPFNRTSYGTLPTPRTRATDFNIGRRAAPQLPSLSFSNLKRVSSVTTAHSTPSLRDLAFSRLSIQRPISAYDAPLQPKGEDADAKINGVRVWYSSFSSIDWLHDAIKDSARFSRLRKRKSLRSRIRLAIDKSLGWFVVTIVGFFSAIVAFLVVRSEQWLFDVKEGYCYSAWWKAKRFCCPALNDFVAGPGGEETCQSWRSWIEIMSPETGGLSSEFMEYTVFTSIALFLALFSALLTIYLTNSTTFVTRKESGVLSPDFPGTDTSSKNPASNAKRKIMYYAAGSGIPEIKTILSGFVIHGYLGGRVLFTKSVGLALSVASGLSLGKEGPFVHIASCIGNIVSRFFGKYENNEAKRREVLSAACAAGVAVAFGAPIGGTLFSLEEVSYFFPPKDWHAYELFPFLLLGVLGGIYGAYFSKLNYAWSKHIRNGTWMKSHPITEVLLITATTTGLCFINRFTRMSGTELVYSLFADCQDGYSSQRAGLCAIEPHTFREIWPIIQAVSVAMVIKACLTIVTFGIKVPAGIFIPSLGVGACAGRIMGLVIQWLQYQELGAKLFPICAKDRDLMLSVLVAKTVADALEPKGIYDLVIELNQLPYLDSKHEYLWGNLEINDVAAHDAEIIRLDRRNTVTTLRDQLVALMQTGNDDSGFPILRPDSNDDGMRMVGYIGANELEHALSLVADEPEVEVHFHTAYTHYNAASSVSSLMEESEHQDQDLFDFSIYMDQAPLTVQSNSPLEMVHQFFYKLGARYVVVTDTEGLYEGVIDKKTWVAFLAGLEEKS
ncbi:hypothetical protein C0993_000709 [Termitomyces sp. T159_Od127]|nr:hypothetical protein C0993_000709 [Termitomyces sp. T159_Od127]